MKITIMTAFFLSAILLSCSAKTENESQSLPSEVLGEQTATNNIALEEENLQQVIGSDAEEELKIYKADVTVGGKVWTRQGIRIEKSELSKMDDKGPFPLTVILEGPAIVGKEYAVLQFSFIIPADYDGSPIRHNLAEGESGVPVISFSEDREVFTTWSAPWIFTWDDVNKRAINEPKTSGTVILEKFDQNTKRLRISFDGLLFGASSDTTTSTKTINGTVDIDFSVYDLLEEVEKMKQQYGL